MDADLSDLLEACIARPDSSALQRALLAAIQGPAPSAVVEHLAGADPAAHDQVHRERVAAFLDEAGRDDAAARWRGEPAETVDADTDPAIPSATVSYLRLATAEPPRQTRVYGSGRPALKFADVGGLEHVKRHIRRKIITPFEKPELFRMFRKRSGGGVLMYGPPGCGKTLLARATAGEANAYFIPVAITDILDKYLGESERKLAEVFDEARRHKPAILFFDELEALTSRNRTSGEAGASLVSTFLSEMDGFAGGNDGVLVIGATNTPWAVDSAFRRPGRFDRVLFVPPPDQPARLAILEMLLQDRPLAAGLDVHPFALSTAGFSGADIANLVETAVELAIEDSHSSTELTPVSRRHLEDALQEVRPTVSEWLATARNYVKYANEGGYYNDVRDFLKAHTK